VPVGGLYRLIDVPMSNCINSGINKIYVLTQYNSQSLNKHLTNTYNFGTLTSGTNAFVEVLAATQTPRDSNWFQGTADAVRQYSWILEDNKNKIIDDVVILSGDHLYRMDYMHFVEAHRESGADITVGCIPCDAERASDFGLMKIDKEARITEFSEKPKGDALKAMEVDTTILGLDAAEAKEKPYIASMGIYVFKKSVLTSLLNSEMPQAMDFGGEIIPEAAKKGLNVSAYLFNDYWEDIGTIKSFYDANLALAKQPPRFEFYDPNFPIYTESHYLPPANVRASTVKDTIIAAGSDVDVGCKINNSVVGLRSIIGKDCNLDGVYMMGADYLESAKQLDAVAKEGGLPIGVGAGTTLKNVIVDKNARIGANCVIVNKEGVTEADRPSEGLYIRTGIVTVAKNATVPAGTVI